MTPSSSEATSRRSKRFPHPEAFPAHVMRRRHVDVGGSEEARALASDLLRAVEGEVRFGDGDRALYAADASNYRQIPVGVVIPRSLEDVVETVRVAREHGAPILPRGAGTSLAGQSINVAVVIDFSKYLDQVIEIDTDRQLARVQPGVPLDALRDEAERYGLTFGPDTSTHAYNSMGGMIGNNSCGVRSVLSKFRGPGSRTSDHLHEMDVLLYDGTRMRVGEADEHEVQRVLQEGGRKGEIYRRLLDLRDRYADRIRERFPDIPRRVSGYNLPELLPENGFHVARSLSGSEGTCAVILEATVLLQENPGKRALVILGFEDIYQAGDHVPAVMEHEPTGVEGIDRKLVANMRSKGLHTEYLEILPEGGGWLLVEFGSKDQQEANEQARRLVRASRGWPAAPSARMIDEWEEAHKAWLVRESGLGATAFVPGEGDHWPGWEDSAVSPDRVGDYYRDIRRLYDKYGYDASLYGHIGQGLLHTRTDFDLYTAEGIEKFKAFTQEAAELVTTKYNGSLSGEHGDGQARGDLLPVMYGQELMEAFREFKRIWDPDWKMNPGKLVDANPRDSDLRLGTNYDPPEPETHFRFPDDQGSFARATLRCVGVGKCRREAGGTMCPSFQVLNEEKHTTRGRAHLLFEMLQGEAVHEGWRSEPVKEALDLCLSCKGCKGECPVNVDIATYKAEFLSHYYEGRLRPRSAYAFGLIEWASRVASLAPDAANLVTQTPGLDRLAKWAAGMAPERKIPAFARQTFRQWWTRRQRRGGGRASGRRVVLWPDVFNDHFHPGVLQAAVEVLEGAGCRVVVPSTWLPAGRPLYEFGMLDLAKWQLRRILDALKDEIRAGTPVVVLEPSVTSVFRDELPNLYPEDEDAKRLQERTFTLGEFLIDEMEGWEPPRLEGRALLHGHCHHKAVLKLKAEPQLLMNMGLQLDMPDTGCCGMAGSFGFEKGTKYRLSIKRGEQALLPAVRDATEDTLVITDGFSCREQIGQGTDRRTLHTAEVLQLAMRRSEAKQWGKRPELQQARLRDPALADSTSPLRGLATLGGALVLGGAALRGLTQLFGNGNHGRHDESEAAARRRAAHLGADPRGRRGRGPRADLVR